MEVISEAHLHVSNGNRHVVEYPEFAGISFQSTKEKERFRVQKVTEVLGKMNGDIPHDRQGDFIFTTVTLPEGITELPPDWKIDPVPIPPKPVENQPVNFDLEDIQPFVSRKPQMQ